MANKITITVQGTPGAPTAELTAFLALVLRNQNIVSRLTGTDGTDAEEQALNKIIANDFAMEKALRGIAESQQKDLAEQDQVIVQDFKDKTIYTSSLPAASGT
jgi:hypothetical protein